MQDAATNAVPHTPGAVGREETMTELNIEDQKINEKTVTPRGVIFARRLFVFLAVFC